MRPVTALWLVLFTACGGDDFTPKEHARIFADAGVCPVRCGECGDCPELMRCNAGCCLEAP